MYWKVMDRMDWEDLFQKAVKSQDEARFQALKDACEELGLTEWQAVLIQNLVKEMRK